AEATIGLELLDALHQADVAFGDEVTDRQAGAPIAHGNLGHDPTVARHQLCRRFGIVMLLVPLCVHGFLLGRQHRASLDRGQVAVEALLTAERRDAQRPGGVVAAHDTSLDLSLSADGSQDPGWASRRARPLSALISYTTASS